MFSFRWRFSNPLNHRGFEEAAVRNAIRISSQPRYDHFDTSPQNRHTPTYLLYAKPAEKSSPAGDEGGFNKPLYACWVLWYDFIRSISNEEVCS